MQRKNVAGRRPKIVAVPIVCPSSVPELSACDSQYSQFIHEFPDDGWSDYDDNAIAKPNMSQSQILASELRLNSVVAGASADSQDFRSLGATTTTEYNIDHDPR